jgi:mRNA-degrading endonuclease YafQ of YafQ-DinJ toxin-antitoxin module
MTIYYSRRFERSYQHLDPQIQRSAEKRVAMFRRDPLDPRLKAHHLHGQLKNLWSFSVDARHRILFEFLDDRRTEVIFLDIGNHSIYQ